MRRSLFSALPSLFSLSDEQAMWRVQSCNDAEAFAGLVERWEEPIQRLCTRMVGDSHRAEDLAQETFTRLFTHRKDYRQSARFSTYLWRIALNLCYDELRRRQCRPETSLGDALSEAPAGQESWCANDPAPDQWLATQERAALVRQALLRLSEAQRAVVVLRHYENLKFREIAEVLGIPEGTAKSRMAEALSLLSGYLQRHVEEGENLCQTIRTKPNQARVLAP